MDGELLPSCDHRLHSKLHVIMFLVFFMPLMELIVTQTQYFAMLLLPICAILQLVRLISALNTADYQPFRYWIMGSFSTSLLDRPPPRHLRWETAFKFLAPYHSSMAGFCLIPKLLSHQCIVTASPLSVAACRMESGISPPSALLRLDYC